MAARRRRIRRLCRRQLNTDHGAACRQLVRFRLPLTGCRLRADRETAGPAAAGDEKDPVAILASVVRRDDAELSATETRERALSDADHLGVLHAIWIDQCRAQAYDRYAQ